MPARINKDIYFLPDGYEVTEDGKVFSTKKNWRGLGVRELHQFYNNNGYKVIHLKHNGKQVKRPIHLLVAYKFLPPRPSSMHQVRHLDGNKENNAVSNLKWGTALENADDRDKHGRTYRGEKHYSSKLTDEQRREIIYDNELNQRKLAEKYNISQASIGYTRKMAVPILISENLELKNKTNVFRDILNDIVLWGKVKDGKFTFTCSEQHANEIKEALQKIS